MIAGRGARDIQSQSTTLIKLYLSENNDNKAYDERI